MRSSFAVRSGLKLARSPSHRQQVARRRTAVIGAVIGLALASGLIGALAGPHGSSDPAARTGPFSYFPTE